MVRCSLYLPTWAVHGEKGILSPALPSLPSRPPFHPSHERQGVHRRPRGVRVGKGKARRGPAAQSAATRRPSTETGRIPKRAPASHPSVQRPSSRSPRPPCISHLPARDRLSPWSCMPGSGIQSVTRKSDSARGKKVIIDKKKKRSHAHGCRDCLSRVETCPWFSSILHLEHCIVQDRYRF